MTAKMIKASFRYVPFSPRQKLILSWWHPDSPYHDWEGIIADGAIRSGKSMSMSLSFIFWSMHSFRDQQFGICGNTIGSIRRNVINDLKRMLRGRGYKVKDYRGDNLLVISKGGVSNSYYLFGGKDESSQKQIQGITLAGILMDEVVLMPESFVNQATGRCSVEGSKLWFNCNPDSRMHFFKLNWINKYQQKRLMYLHFTMDDNWSLSDKIKERYRNMYVGMFFRRFILGEWVSASGVIYDMWTEENLFDDNDPRWVEIIKNHFAGCRHYVACDYGTTNPMVFLDVYDDGTTFWIANEYYYDSRKMQRQKTDSQYGTDFEEFIQRDKSVSIIMDPSAESFRIELRNRGYRVIGADNDVLDGIHIMSTMIQKRRVMAHRKNCPYFQREIDGYVWDEKASLRGVEQPVKVGDHAMDAMRYLLKTTVKRWRISK